MAISKRFKIILVFVVLSALLLISFVVTVLAASGVPRIEWSKTYGEYEGHAVVQAADGGYVIAGTTGVLVSGSHQVSSYVNSSIILIKTDLSGSKQWSKIYGEVFSQTTFNSTFENTSFSQSVVTTKDGGYAVLGYKNVLVSPSNRDVMRIGLLIKVGLDGNEQWRHTYGGTPNDVLPYTLIQTSDGGYAMVGMLSSPDVEGEKAWFVKINANGSVQWEKTYENIGSRFITQATDGGYVFAGMNNESTSVVVSKTDQAGNVLWNKQYPAKAFIYGFAPTSDGGYLLVGRMHYTNGTGPHGYAVKIDSQGNMQWNTTYEKGVFQSALEANGGGYIFAGATQIQSSQLVSVGWLVKTDSYGNVELNATYEGLGEGYANSLIQATDGGYVFVGKTSDVGAIDAVSQIWLVKLAPSPEAIAKTWIVALTAIAIVAVVGVSLFIYYRKRKR